MIEGYGNKSHLQQTILAAVTAGVAREYRIKTNKYFKYLTGVSIYEFLEEPGWVAAFKNILFGIKKNNVWIVNPIPATLFMNSQYINMIDSLFRMNTIAQNDEVIFYVENNSALTFDMTIFLYYENIPYNQIYQYNNVKVDFGAGSTFKLNLDAKCKIINGISFNSIASFDVSIYDQQVRFLDNVNMTLFNMPVFVESDKRFLKVDIPVTDLWISEPGIGGTLNLAYRYTPKQYINERISDR